MMQGLAEAANMTKKLKSGAYAIDNAGLMMQVLAEAANT